MNLGKTKKRLSLSFEPAFQIIYYSIMSICFCVAIIFATTIQAVNWYTIIFLFLSIILAYFKRGTHVIFTETGFDCIYFRGMKEKEFVWERIKEIDSHYPSRKIVIKEKGNHTSVIYLNQANHRKLLEVISEQNAKITINKKES